MRRPVFVASMFIIIGGDGKEYGPVTADQVRTWINAGRANLDTKAKALGSEEWRRLGDYAEFSSPTGAPPMISSGSLRVDTVDTSGLVPAQRGTRLLARVIDWALELVVAIPGGMILGPDFIKLVVMTSQGQELNMDDVNVPRLGMGAAVLAFSWLALLVVQVWMLTTRGQSIGKRITNIRIVRVEDGRLPGIVNAWVLRELLMTVLGFTAGLIPILGPFMLRPAFHIVDWCLIFRDDQRCLHDLIAKTRVVQA